MTRRIAMNVAICAALTVSMLGVSPAFAEEYDEYSDIQGPSESGLVVEKPGKGPNKPGDITTFSVKLGASPAGCYGQTDYAHKSTTYASVHGRTRCTFPVSSLGVSTILQKQGWFYWESMLTDHSSATNSANSQDAHPHWNCSGWGSQNYRGVSTHWSKEGGSTYSATTVGSEARFTC